MNNVIKHFSLLIFGFAILLTSPQPATAQNTWSCQPGYTVIGAERRFVCDQINRCNPGQIPTDNCPVLDDYLELDDPVQQLTDACYELLEEKDCGESPVGYIEGFKCTNPGSHSCETCDINTDPDCTNLYTTIEACSDACENQKPKQLSYFDCINNKCEKVKEVTQYLSMASCLKDCRMQGMNETEICNRLGGPDDPMRRNCLACYSVGGMWTALGCISREGITSQISNFITLGISIAGGLALLLILYGSFLISTSAGDPQKVGEGKEIATAAVAGLVFIILSIVMLNFIGIHILNIPGF